MTLSNSRVFISFAVALLAFDTLLTLSSEIKHIWGKQFRIGTILYLLARYPLLAIYLIDIYTSLFVTSIPVC